MGKVRKTRSLEDRIARKKEVVEGLESQIDALQAVLDQENPAELKCQSGESPKCLGSSVIGGHKVHSKCKEGEVPARMFITMPEDSANGESAHVCWKCGLHLRNEMGLKSIPIRRHLQHALKQARKSLSREGSRLDHLKWKQMDRDRRKAKREPAGDLTDLSSLFESPAQAPENA